MTLRNMLRLNIQFFAADGGSGGAGDGGDGGTPDASGTPDKTGDSGEPDTSWIDELYAPEPDDKEDGSDKDQMIPKKRFDSVNSKFKDLTGANKTLSETHEKLQGEFTTLTEAHAVATKRVESLEGVLIKMVDAELEQIDGTYHDLIPQDKTVEEKLDWILKAKQKGMFGLGQGSYEYEIGGMSNPGGANRGRNTNGMNPLQLMTMGYGSK